MFLYRNLRKHPGVYGSSGNLWELYFSSLLGLRGLRLVRGDELRRAHRQRALAAGAEADPAAARLELPGSLPGDARRGGQGFQGYGLSIDYSNQIKIACSSNVIVCCV